MVMMVMLVMVMMMRVVMILCHIDNDDYFLMSLTLEFSPLGTNDQSLYSVFL